MVQDYKPKTWNWHNNDEIESKYKGEKTPNISNKIDRNIVAVSYQSSLGWLETFWRAAH